MHSERAALAAILLTMVAPLGSAVAAPAAKPLADDVRCLLVSSSFTRMAKDDQARSAAAMTSAYYLGRLNASQRTPALVAAIRAQGAGIASKEAGSVMRDCAMRAQAAEQAMLATVREAQAAK